MHLVAMTPSARSELVMQCVQKYNRHGVSLDESLAHTQDLNRAARIVSLNIQKQQKENIAKWHATTGRDLVKKAVEALPLLSDISDSLVPIPNPSPDTLALTVRRDLTLVSEMVKVAHSQSRQKNMYAALGEAFAARTKPIMEKDCKLIPEKKKDQKERPCLAMCVCLCDPAGTVLYLFRNRVLRAIKMIIPRGSVNEKQTSQPSTTFRSIFM